MNTTTTTRLRRVRKLRVVPQIKVHPEIHAQLVDLADDRSQTIQHTLHLILCERFGRPELIHRTMLETAAPRQLTQPDS